MKQTLVFLFLIASITSHAHILNKTHLVLEEHAGKTATLTVVFKTSQLVDILTFKYPELNNKGLNSIEFKEKATEYFNETISISLQENKYQLSILNYEFDGLQSSARFIIENIASFVGAEIQITSFYEIDAHMLHDLTFINNGKFESIAFTKEASTQIISSQIAKKSNDSWFKTFDFLILFLAGIGLIPIYYNRKKLVLFLQHRNKTEVA